MELEICEILNWTNNQAQHNICRLTFILIFILLQLLFIVNRRVQNVEIESELDPNIFQGKLTPPFYHKFRGKSYEKRNKKASKCRNIKK